MIEYTKFHPVKKVGSLIGFCGFKYNGIGFSEIAVHRLLKPKCHIKVRLLYPEKIEPTREMQLEIDEEINAYILTNYKSSLDGK